MLRAALDCFSPTIDIKTNRNIIHFKSNHYFFFLKWVALGCFRPIIDIKTNSAVRWVWRWQSDGIGAGPVLVALRIYELVLYIYFVALETHTQKYCILIIISTLAGIKLVSINMFAVIQICRIINSLAILST